MSNPFQIQQGDNHQFDVRQAVDDASHLGGQIWHDMRTEGPKIADYVGKTPAVGDVAGALFSLAIAAAPEAPPVAVGLGTLGVTIFTAKTFYDLAKPAIDKAGEAVLKFPAIQ